jgi:di/tricarboxylate transporter
MTGDCKGNRNLLGECGLRRPGLLVVGRFSRKWQWPALRMAEQHFVSDANMTCDNAPYELRAIPPLAMSLAAISLAALVLALLVSCISSVNIGFLGILLAWVVGTLGGMSLTEVIAGFPSSLFLTLVGVTLLFSQAQANGTLDRLARPAIHLCRGKAGAIPMMFFALTAALSSIGPGNIASTALMAPMGMAAAGRYGISPFLMAIMIANGASAGSVSPIAPTGIIVNNVARNIGLGATEWPVYLNNLVAHAVIAFSGYLLLGGWKLFSRPSLHAASASDAVLHIDKSDTAAPVTWQQRLTIAVIVGLILCVILVDLNVGMVAFGGAILLTFSRAADENAAVRQMPWKAIMMVCGVTTLIAILEKTGGMSLFTDFLARMSTPATATAVTAFFTGLVSIYSSTTGVVLPAFLPTIPGLIERMGGGDAMALLSSMTVGGHLVDVSPVSTLGALCIAAAPPGTDLRGLFNQLLAWGVSMSLVGALVCWLVF